MWASESRKQTFADWVGDHRGSPCARSQVEALRGRASRYLARWDPDGFYASLIALHTGLSPEQSQKLNSKLVLVMANQIGDRAILNQILDAVRNRD